VVVVESDLRRGGGMFVVVAGVLEGAERFVPVGLEAVGDKPVVRVDREVAATGELSALAGPFDVGAPQGVCFVGASFELGLDGEGDLERERSDGVEEQTRDRSVDVATGDGLATTSSTLDRLADALVVRPPWPMATTTDENVIVSGQARVSLVQQAR
jgi:hypothetical protein